MLETMLLMSSLLALATSDTCPTTFAAACGVPLAYGLNSTQEAAILAAHNRLRNYVALGLETRGSPGPQPAASNMRLMTWNVELATLAQSWANQCNFTHNNCGGSTNFSVGQNIYAVIATKLIMFNVTQPVGSWYDEVQYFNKSSISPFVYMEKADHYTQVAWANSYYLGCGFVAYRNSSSGNVWHTMVCNYGPAGNYVGGTMYNATGSACETCTARTSCSKAYTGLCG